MTAGYCEKKDWKLHEMESDVLCVNLEVYYGIGAIILDRDVRDGLCNRFSQFVNETIGHNSEPAISSPLGYKQCYLHYSKEELNRLGTTK